MCFHNAQWNVTFSYYDLVTKEAFQDCIIKNDIGFSVLLRKCVPTQKNKTTLRHKTTGYMECV